MLDWHFLTFIGIGAALGELWLQRKPVCAWFVLVGHNYCTKCLTEKRYDAASTEFDSGGWTCITCEAKSVVRKNARIEKAIEILRSNRCSK